MIFEKMFKSIEIIVPLADCSGCAGCATQPHSKNKFSKTGADNRRKNATQSSPCSC